MPPEQMDLFKRDTPSRSSGSFRDPAFSENRALPIHRWVPWIAGYSAQFVNDVLAVFAASLLGGDRSPLVLDPFAGVGTTLVQAMMHGYRTVGFEINPYAALAARVKVETPWIDIGELTSTISRFRDALNSRLSNGIDPNVRPPAGFKTRVPFFSPRVEKKVLVALELINDIHPQIFRDLLRLAMGSVMVSFSNYSYEPSLGTRMAAGKAPIEDADVANILLDKLRQMRADIAWVQNGFNGVPPTREHHLYNEDFLVGARARLPAGSVDIMITSPPYMNNYHYVRNSRPHLYWLSLVEDRKSTRTLEEVNFGKFWQTVRAGPKVEPKYRSLSFLRKLRELTKVRSDKGPYGGPGWANYVATYVNDCASFSSVLYEAMRPGGIGVVVVGNSIIQGIEFQVDAILGEIAEAQGFDLKGIRQIRDKRVGTSITRSTVRRGKRNRTVLYESAVVIEKPSVR